MLSGGVRATLRIEPRARRTDPPHVKLTLGSIRPKPELLGEGWAQRPPVVHTRFTTEQRAVLMELFEKPERPNDTQMFESFKARFSNADGPYARVLRLTRAQIKSFMSTEKGRRKKAAAAGGVAAALQDGSLEAEDGDEGDEGDEGDGGCDDGDDEAQRREAALSGAGGSGTARGVARAPAPAAARPAKRGTPARSAAAPAPAPAAPAPAPPSKRRASTQPAAVATAPAAAPARKKRMRRCYDPSTARLHPHALPDDCTHVSRFKKGTRTLTFVMLLLASTSSLHLTTAEGSLSLTLVLFCVSCECARARRVCV